MFKIVLYLLTVIIVLILFGVIFWGDSMNRALDHYCQSGLEETGQCSRLFCRQLEYYIPGCPDNRCDIYPGGTRMTTCASWINFPD